MTLSTDTVASLSAQSLSYFKQVAETVFIVGAKLVPVEEQDYNYRMSFKGNIVRAQTLDVIVDWFHNYGQHERLLANQAWTINESYDLTEAYPFINASELEAGQMVRLPFSKGRPWRILNLGQETAFAIVFRYETTIENTEPNTVSFAKLWRFQLLEHANGKSAYQGNAPF